MQPRRSRRRRQTTAAPSLRANHSFPQHPLGVRVLDRQTVLRPEHSQIEFTRTTVHEFFIRGDPRQRAALMPAAFGSALSITKGPAASAARLEQIPSAMHVFIGL